MRSDFVNVRFVIISGLWVASVGLLAVRTVMYDWPQVAVLSAWALWLSSAALAVTGWQIVACLLMKHRVHVEELIEKERIKFEELLEQDAARTKAIAKFAAETVLEGTGPRGVVR